MEEGAERNKSHEEDMSVLLYCKLLNRFHWLFFVVFLLVHLSFLGISVALYMNGHDVLPLVFDDLPLDLHNDDMFLRYQAWNNRPDETSARKKRSAPAMMPDMPNFGLNIEPKEKKYDFSFDQRSPFDRYNFGDDEHFHSHYHNPAEITLHENEINHFHNRIRVKRQNTGAVSTNLNERRSVLADMEIIYETTDDSNLLTKERLLAIKDFEAKLLGSPGFTDYCRTEIYNRTHLRCFGLASVLRFFDPLFVASYKNQRYSDATMSRVPFFLTILWNSTNYRDELQYFLGRDTKFDFARNIIETNRIRTQVTFGFPLKEYLGATDISNSVKHLEKWRKDYAKKHLLPYMQEAAKKELPGQPIRVLYFLEQLYWSEVRDQVFKDWGFLIGGIVMIIVSCWFYLDSLFITLFGMLSIVTSFAGANLMYRYMFQYQYFGIFNVLAVFIVIGIGVDDILIYVGTWRHYVNRNVKDLDVLTSVVFRKAATAMFFTSLSTMVAFFVNTPSTLLAISAFGSFAGLCILVNYLTVVTFIPTVVLIHHIYFEKFSFLCCCNRYKKLTRVVQSPPKAVAWHSRAKGGLWGSNSSNFSGGNQIADNHNNSFGPPVIPWGFTSDPLYSPYFSLSDPLNIGNTDSQRKNNSSNSNSMSAIRRVPFYDHLSSQAWHHNNQFGARDNLDHNFMNHPGGQEVERDDSRTSSSASIIHNSGEQSRMKVYTLSERFNNACVNFLSGTFFRFISNELVNVVIFVIFFAITFGNCVAVTRLKLGDSDVPIFHQNHPFEKSRIAVRDGFLLNPYEQTVNVAMLWGMKLQDLSSCNRLHYKKQNERCRGESVYDNTFDLNDPSAQLDLLNLCKELIEPTDELKERLKLYTDISTGQTEAICFIYYLDQFLNVIHDTTNISSVVDVRLPITKEKMQIVMLSQPNIFDSQYINTISRPFELAFDFFLNNGYTGQPITDRRYELRNVMHFERINNVNIAADKANSFIYEKRLKYAAVTVRTSVPIIGVDIDNGVKFMDAWEDFFNSRLEIMPEGSNKGFQVAFTWMWLRTLSNLVIQSGVGLGVSLVLAFFVIFLGTGNIITSLAILILLACVTISCVALITLASWKFSLLEAINMCIVVGLAVDYVVHLAESYHLSVYTSRKDRLQDALERVGMPVIAGACTTLMSAFFMLFGKIVFFVQFGAFLFCTLGFSVIFTMFVMTSFYNLMGPQGDFGSVSGCIRRIKKKLGS